MFVEYSEESSYTVGSVVEPGRHVCFRAWRDRRSNSGVGT